MSSDPDFDDLNGYQADTSINTNDSNDTRSSTPVMTLSDDLLSNPACWPTHHADRIRARLLSLMELLIVPTTTPSKEDPSSVMEPESKIEEPPPVPPPPPQEDPSSITEPESEPEEPPIKNLPPIKHPPPKDDPSSVMEPESEPEEPPIKTPIKGATTTPKKKSFFDTPSPPGPDSLYWKLGTDQSFDTVRKIKAELRDLH
ncbi:hypothetical protein DFJ58DRAFT_848123 [Suillus subalutaceus]|uniref:uncharacterized protein n=1 Tax=Suillus subalutaceus TaxID=48586 RepID=UPI001B8728C5|nr:uncharacterized protein DFJ58DRAFT_848123 [Suillus subalutaceus]KAG1831925.1 hypothetical protein DFJ58DRAFT_848123 [Suillus subalutaceus]